MKKSSDFDVSVIIVNWNAGKYLKETIDSVHSMTQNISYEIIIMDNNSNPDDESYLFLKQIAANSDNLTIIFNNENLGFAKANNKAMKIARGRNFLLLNPDVLLHDNCVKTLCDYLDSNDYVAMVGPKVLNADGSFQQPCLRGKPYPSDTLFHITGLAKMFPKCEKLNGYALWHLDRDKIQECYSVSGCCMMVKKSLCKAIGGMDEDFFLYQEETDWGLRTINAGYKVVYNPNTTITHYQGVTTKKVRLKSILYFTQSMERFFKKHFWKKYNFVQKSFWMTLIWGNMTIKWIKQRRRSIA